MARPRSSPKSRSPARAPRAATPALPAAPFRWEWLTLAALAAYALVMGATLLVAHRVPGYDVETDLMGTYIPAARALRAGHLTSDALRFHGLGYPALLAPLGALCGGDDWLAARLLNLIAALASGWLAFALVRRVWDARVGAFATLALLATPAFARATLEAGTDLPALALMLGAMLPLFVPSGPRALAAAGALAALAITTRASAVFLTPAAIVVLWTRRARSAEWLAYLLGLAVPAALAIAATVALTGGLASDENYANIAYEFYGRNVSWERFWTTTRGSFHSLADVVRFGPGRFVAHLAQNLATRWVRDAHELMPVWLGALAVPGLALTLRGRRGAGALIAHVALAYAVLAFAFYVPRFFLVLLPFYLAGAAALVLESRWPPFARVADAPAEPRGVAQARVGLLVALVAASAVMAAREVRGVLADAPLETRVAGEWLRGQGVSGRVMARKPHVAYFAGADYAPFPAAATLGELIRAARRDGVGAVFLSPIELGLRPQFAPFAALSDGVPGLRLMRRDASDRRHAYTLFRVTDEVASDAALDSVQVASGTALARATLAGPGDPAARARTALMVVGNLIDLGRAKEALAPLAEAERIAPDDPRVLRMRTLASMQLGDWPRAAATCERAIALGHDTAWERGQLGTAKLMMGRYAEARPLLERAVQGEPANGDFVENLGIALYYTGDRAGALRHFERSFALTPDYEEPLIYIARILLLEGRRDEAARRLAKARTTMRFQSAPLRGLADSLGVR